MGLRPTVYDYCGRQISVSDEAPNDHTPSTMILPGSDESPKTPKMLKTYGSRRSARAFNERAEKRSAREVDDSPKPLNLKKTTEQSIEQNGPNDGSRSGVSSNGDVLNRNSDGSAQSAPVAASKRDASKREHPLDSAPLAASAPLPSASPKTPIKPADDSGWSVFDGLLTATTRKKVKLQSHDSDERRADSKETVDDAEEQQVVLNSLGPSSPSLQRTLTAGASTTPSQMPNPEAVRSSIVSTSARKTYSGQRSYASPMTSKSMTSIDEDHYSDHSDEEGNFSENELDSTVKNANELRALGGSSQHMLAIRNAADGVKGDLNLKRFTLEDIARNLSDDDYVDNLKASTLPSTIMVEIPATKDPYCLFFLALIFARLFRDGIGLAASMISQYPVIDILVGMLPEWQDIRKIVAADKKGVTKHSVNLLKKYISDHLSESVKGNVSPALVALNCLVVLETLGPVTPQVHRDLIKNLDGIVTVLDCRVSLVEAAINPSETERAVEKTADGSGTDTAVLQDFHTLLVQLEFIFSAAPSGDEVNVIRAFESPGRAPLASLSRIAVRVLLQFYTSDSAVQKIITVIIQVWIVITTNLSAVNEYPGEYFSVGLANALVNFIDKSALSSPEQENMLLYCCGLLVNLTDSRIVRRGLLKSDSLDLMKKWLVPTPRLPKTKLPDILGYKYLAVGKLYSGDINGGSLPRASAEELTQGLRQFQSQVQGGLRGQIDQALKGQPA